MQTADDRAAAQMSIPSTATIAGELERPAADLGAKVKKARSPAGDAVRSLQKQPIALLGAAIVLTWLALGLLAPVLPIDDPNKQDTSIRLQPPSWEHPFGTDDLGRDL